MTSDKKNRRQVSNLVIDARALLRISVPFFVVLVLNLIILFVVNFQISKFLSSTNFIDDGQMLLVQLFSKNIIYTLIFGNFLLGLISTILWVIYSHRILGPVVPIQRQIKNLIAGHYNDKVVLRKNDELRSVAEGLNQLADILKKSKGQSILQVVVSVGIMGVLTLALLTILETQNREGRALNEKMASLDLQRQMNTTLSDGSVCTFQVNQLPNATFDSSLITPNTSVPDISLGNVLLAKALATSPPIVTVNQAVSPASQTLVASDIVINNIQCSPPCPDPKVSNIFNATLQVKYDNSRLVRSIKPATSLLTLTTEDAGGSMKKIISCSTSVATDSSIGSTVQIKQTLLTTVFSTTSTSFTNVTGLGVTVSGASAATNKFLVRVSAVFSNASGNQNVAFRLVRDSTPICVATNVPGSEIVAGAGGFVGTALPYWAMPLSMECLDAPGDTNSHTYQLQMATQTNGPVVAYINRRGDEDGSSSFYQRYASTITAIEFRQ